LMVNSSQFLIYSSSKSVIEYRQLLEELTKSNGMTELEALRHYNEERKGLESQSSVEKRKGKEVNYSRRQQRQQQKQEGGLDFE
jgi:hypothetical protein